jgi:hypothetical protein
MKKSTIILIAVIVFTVFDYGMRAQWAIDCSQGDSTSCPTSTNWVAAVIRSF